MSPPAKHPPIDLPATIADVDAAWLMKALRQTYPDIEVYRAECVKSMGGACTKLRMMVDTNIADFPPSVIVKGCFEPHAQSMIPMQLKEAQIYAEIVPQLEGIETIRTFFIQSDRKKGSALILEDLDLRGVKCGHAQQPLASFALAADYLSNVARMHARWWNSAEVADDGALGDFAPLEVVCIPYIDVVLADPETYAEKYRLPRAACLSRKILDGPRILAAYHRLKEKSRSMPVTLVHGDLHPSNLYVTPDNHGGLLDWNSMRVPWALDVAYFIGGNLDPVDRREWESPLLQHYLSELRNHGVEAPSFVEAWDDYRCWMLWGMYVWLFNIPEYHSEENITAMTARFGAAFLDLGTLDLIEA